MDKGTFSAGEVGKRLEEVLKSEDSDDAVAAALKRATGYITTGEKIRRARNGEVQKIAHDLLAAVSVAYGVSLDSLVFGAGEAEAESPPPGEEERANAEPIGDAERLKLSRLLTEVQATLLAGPLPSTAEVASVVQSTAAVPPVPPSQVALPPPKRKRGGE